MGPSLSISKSFRLLLLASILALLHRLTLADPPSQPPYTNCSISANITSNSIFQDNLNYLLNSLSSNASASIFYNATTGNDPYSVYGNFLCYGYVSLSTCQICVSGAAKDIKNLCPSSAEAVVWEEYCQLRYSNQNFFGVMDYSTNLPLYNKKNISDPDQFSLAVKNMLGNLSKQAAFDPSTNFYAAGETNLTKLDNLYGLVQCTRDLSGNDCNRCLQSAIATIQGCCYFYRGARVYTRNCYLRYELYPLVEVAAPPPSIETPKKGDRGKLLLVVIITVAAAFLVVALLSFFVCYQLQRKKALKEKNVSVNPGAPFHASVTATSTNFSPKNVQGTDQMNLKEFPLISLANVHAATSNFSDLNKLGQGGFGPVYKGTLPDGREVAVKRLSSCSEQGSEEFMNEVLLIMKLQHKSLVRLLGCCIEAEEKILVYEYMPNSSLDVFLFDPRRRAQLDWRKRINIINGIARGLLYLHHDSRLRIIHRDLKASNVLLDHGMNPKISDFGMARIFGGTIGEASTNRIVGTYGYMAPEYAMEGLYSIKSDVFSFGVLLLEIVTGKRNAGFHLSGHAPSLLAYAWRLWNDGQGLELMDPLLTESYSTTEFLKCIHVALLCAQEDANERPDMSSVVVMLGGESAPLHQPQQPAFSMGRYVVQCDLSLDHSSNKLTISGVLPR